MCLGRDDDHHHGDDGDDDDGEKRPSGRPKRPVLLPRARVMRYSQRSTLLGNKYTTTQRAATE